MFSRVYTTSLGLLPWPGLGLHFDRVNRLWPSLGLTIDSGIRRIGDWHAGLGKLLFWPIIPSRKNFQNGEIMYSKWRPR